MHRGGGRCRPAPNTDSHPLKLINAYVPHSTHTSAGRCLPTTVPSLPGPGALLPTAAAAGWQS
ncbi:MAG: hypothetical protein JW797_00080, partial [Bradymonadales bacterium]|nr:hypothetical protein [Bradymonadales bacterium]